MIPLLLNLRFYKPWHCLLEWKPPSVKKHKAWGVEDSLGQRLSNVYWKNWGLKLVLTHDPEMEIINSTGPVEITHMGRKYYSILLLPCVPAEQKNPFHRCLKREEVKAVRYKTESSRANNSLQWDHFGLMEVFIVAVVSLLDFVSLQGSSIMKASCRQDTAAPGVRPHAGLFAALQSLSDDLWLLSNAAGSSYICWYLNCF